MTTFNMYIGANNDTKVVELDKIKTELDKEYTGYTIQNAEGVWMGQHEDSVVVTIVSEQSALESVTRRLKSILNQDSIALQQVSEMRFL